MFERFSDGSRRAIVWAQEEALGLADPHIGTEHLLLGLLHEPDSDGALLLGRFGVTADGVRAIVIDQRAPQQRRGSRKQSGHIPFTSNVKRAFDRGVDEALGRHAASVTPAGLVLGLLDLPDCAAAKLLTSLVDVVQLREYAEQSLRE